MAAHELNPQWQLSDLLSGMMAVSPKQERTIFGLTLDSREVLPGSLFLACAGGTSHGLDFLRQVVEKGAAAILCEAGGDWSQSRIEGLADESQVPLLYVPGLSQQLSLLAARFHNDPSSDLTVIGFTGTNGKTSCTQFLAEALRETTPCGLVGTLGSGFPGSLVMGRHTTPGPVELQATLADLREHGAQAVAMEVSSHALNQGRVAAVHFDLAVLTNLSRDHLDFHGDMAEYAAAKQCLFECPDLGCAVLNLDDPFGWQLLDAIAADVPVVAYGLSRPERPIPAQVEAWLWASEVVPTEQGLHIKLETSWGDGCFDSALLGRFNASNLLAVLAVLLKHGMPLELAMQRLAKLTTVSGRMEHFGGGTQPLVVVDYAHTPDALEQVITALRPHASGRLCCVFGCGGDRDQGKRPLMGAIAERLADLVILTDDNPRGEDGDQIIADILAGMKRPDAAKVQRNRAVAIDQAIAAATAGDLVLVSGKGHETVQQCGDLRLHFSDLEQVQNNLNEGENG
ncbi:UDP-N-acetylmuramoylalanyl-D-glutamate--2,6-diaminopimelate ligase [hydrothermal vent metagenome]|uniref:UDP-N-acetylmuramoylalanyl-D-glutamate--2,6-diaminopimelate ligase n=1 Tax=hydrothermal vent metagenome TaxID=652676 RepID=A0A3B1AS37_9ZZZZ